MSSKWQKPAHYDTIVIGAGTAGLACASRLFKHPRFQQPNSLLILEGRDRIGGRVDAVHVNGSRLDTGANWIHGIGTEDSPNPLTELVPEERCRELSSTVVFRPPPCKTGATKPQGHEKQDDDWVTVDSQSLQPQTLNQNLVIPSDVAGPLMGALWGTIGALHVLASTTSASEAKDTTVLQALHKSGSLKDAFKTVPDEYHRALSAMPQFIEVMEAAPLAAQSCEHPQDQPGVGLLEYAIDDFDGAQVFLRDGYLSVLDGLAKDIVEAGVVMLNSTVKLIDWKASGSVTVESTSGTYSAKRVICTLPLGVLQKDAAVSVSGSKSTSLFQPPLPSDKVEAIASLGFGTLDKIFMVYSKAWWTEKPYSAIFKQGRTKSLASDGDEGPAGEDASYAPDSLIGFTEELPGIEVDRDGRPQSGIRVLSVINLHALTGYPVLSVFVSCANATYIEALSDADASALVHRSLTSWLGREPPTPEAVHVTRWAQDEFSRGSYSHMIAGVSETRHREAFQTPVVRDDGGELRFAGEHTSRNHFATVHGALLSGIREADAIIASTP